MPRRKAGLMSGSETDDSGQPLASVETLPRPEGMSDSEWTEAGAIGTILGNVSLACRLLDVTSGKRAPADAREVSELTVAARKLEDRSFKRYTRLRESVGQKIKDAKQANARYIAMLADLRYLEDDPTALVGHNGHGGPLDTIAIPITGEIGGTVGPREDEA